MRVLLVLASLLLAFPALAQDTYSSLASPVTPADMAAEVSARNSAIATATTGLATNANLTAIQASIPTAAVTAPPGVSDTGTAGTMTTIYALANHTHASKARKGRVLVPATGTFAVTFSAAFSTAPICAVTAEATAGDTNVVNAQIDGVTTPTGMTIRITRTAQSAVALLGLTILSVPTQIATYAQYVCLEP